MDLTLVSESWEREDETIHDILDDNDLTVISNPYQRRGRGGRPVIIVNHANYNVDKLDIPCPWGVEAVWGVLSPKNATSLSKIQKIIVCSFYSKPNSRQKTKLLDHISDVFHLMSARYNRGLYFIFGADSNDLRLGPILALNPKFKQCVTEATHNLSILDPIITDLHPFYQVPIVMEPLEADTETGEMSDHKMVLMKPLNTIDCEKKVETKTIETRVFSEDNFATMGRKLENFDWKFLESYPFINDRMEIFHNTLLGLFSECFPLKKRII